MYAPAKRAIAPRGVKLGACGNNRAATATKIKAVIIKSFLFIKSKFKTKNIF
jgi:hypothetical protein